MHCPECKKSDQLKLYFSVGASGMLTANGEIDQETITLGDLDQCYPQLRDEVLCTHCDWEGSYKETQSGQ